MHMCRMLGFNGKLENKLLEPFRKLAVKGKLRFKCPENETDRHVDGWGIAGFNSNDMLFDKSVRNAYKDVQFLKTANKLLDCSIGLLHLRRASSNLPIAVDKSHPFLKDGWFFAHNGGIEGFSYQEGGLIDSEWIFWLLLDNGLQNPQTAIIRMRTALLDKYPEGFSSLNFLAIQSNLLIAYCEIGNRCLNNEHERAYYTLYYRIDAQSLLICSEPLVTDAHSNDSNPIIQDWTPFKQCQLLTCRLGEGFVLSQL